MTLVPIFAHLAAKPPINRRALRLLAGGVLIVAGAAVAAVLIDQISHRLAHSVVRDITQKQATTWQSRIIGLLRYKEESFRLSTITDDDKIALQHFIRASDTYRFIMFDAEGSAFWSSKVSKIGTTIEGPYLATHLRGGRIYHTFVTKPIDEIDILTSAPLLHGSGTQMQQQRTVSEIYVPVFQNGQFLGAVEHYKDVTDDIQWYASNIRMVGGIVSLLATVLLLTTLCQVVSAGRKREEQLQTIAETQRVALADKSLRNRESRLISELNEWLQSCRSMDELYSMVGEFLARLMPDCAGSLYVFTNSRDVLVGAKSWNGGTCHTAIHADDCWGLRRGRVYSFGENEVNFACTHVEGPSNPYCCVPILAHGDTIGMLHFSRLGDCSCPQKFGEWHDSEQRKLSLMCAEQISLAIANVRLRDQLRDQSIKDSLTGLFNKRYMQETLRRELSRAKRAGHHLTVLSLDVDHFKTFNDNHGHDAGDIVLRAVGEALTRSVRTEDVVCRNGGEEFVVLMPGIEPGSALRRAEEIRTAVSEISIRYASSLLPRITISIGAAVAPAHGMEPDQLLQIADAALYESKRSGRDRVTVAALPASESVSVAVEPENTDARPAASATGQSRLAA